VQVRLHDVQVRVSKPWAHDAAPHVHVHHRAILRERSLAARWDDLLDDASLQYDVHHDEAVEICVRPNAS